MRDECTIERGDRDMASSQEAMRAEMEALNKQTDGIQPVLDEALEISEEKAVTETETSVDNESVVSDEEKAITEPPVPQKPPDNENFRRLREKNKELEQKMYELESRLHESRLVKDKPAPKEETIEDYELKDDDLTEGKHYKALKREVRNLNEAIAKSNAEREKLAVEARLRANYPDIFKIVTKENMEALAEQEPEFVESIVSSPNIYSQHVAAYKLIKKYSIGTADPYQADKDRAQKNMAKPKSSATVAPRQGESPLSEASRFENGLTADLQAQLLKEMEEAISNR